MENEKVIRPIKFIPEEIDLSKIGYISIDQGLLSEERNAIARKFYIGKVGFTNRGYPYRILNYKNCDCITIQFLDQFGAKLNVGTREIQSGMIKNPYEMNVYGGYMGVGKYRQANPEHKNIYFVWFNMIRRIDPRYSEQREKEGYCSYRDDYVGKVTVCQEWYNFQVFAEWYENYYNQLNHSDGERYQLDKDILQFDKEYKVYCPEGCCLVPAQLNNLVAGLCVENTSLNLPTGVQCAGKGKYRVYSGSRKNRVSLGKFDNLDDAFQAYKTFKETHLRDIAEEYYADRKILPNVLEAIYNINIKDWRAKNRLK